VRKCSPPRHPASVFDGGNRPNVRFPSRGLVGSPKALAKAFFYSFLKPFGRSRLGKLSLGGVELVSDGTSVRLRDTRFLLEIAEIVRGLNRAARSWPGCRFSGLQTTPVMVGQKTEPNPRGCRSNAASGTSRQLRLKTKSRPRFGCGGRVRRRAHSRPDVTSKTPHKSTRPRHNAGRSKQSRE
jgi:hypothetical protein